LALHPSRSSQPLSVRERGLKLPVFEDTDGRSQVFPKGIGMTAIGYPIPRLDRNPG